MALCLVKHKENFTFTHHYDALYHEIVIEFTENISSAYQHA